MRIGFIGLGSMGRPMSLNVLKAGHQLTVHDVDRDGRGARELLEAGAKWANTPKEAAAHAEVVFTSLPTPREVEAVTLGADGIIFGAQKGSVYVDLSTSSPSLARKIYKTFREKGVAALDSPVSQGTARSKYEGTLTLMVGGDRDVFERVKPVLEAIGRGHLVYCGDAGAGQICKLVNNLAGIANGVALAEALSIGVKAGVSVEKLLEVICQSSGRSLASEGMLANLDKPRNFDNPDSFSLMLARKDVRLAVDLARELEIPVEVACVVEQKQTEAVARGWGKRTSGVHILIQEEKAGVDLCSKAQKEAEKKP